MGRRVNDAFYILLFEAKDSGWNNMVASANYKGFTKSQSWSNAKKFETLGQVVVYLDGRSEKLQVAIAEYVKDREPYGDNCHPLSDFFDTKKLKASLRRAHTVETKDKLYMADYAFNTVTSCTSYGGQSYLTQSLENNRRKGRDTFSQLIRSLLDGTSSGWGFDKSYYYERHTVVYLSKFNKYLHPSIRVRMTELLEADLTDTKNFNNAVSVLFSLCNEWHKHVIDTIAKETAGDPSSVTDLEKHGILLHKVGSMSSFIDEWRLP